MAFCEEKNRWSCQQLHFECGQWSPLSSSISKLNEGTSPSFCLICNDSFPTCDVRSKSGIRSNSSPEYINYINIKFNVLIILIFGKYQIWRSDSDNVFGYKFVALLILVFDTNALYPLLWDHSRLNIKHEIKTNFYIENIFLPEVNRIITLRQQYSYWSNCKRLKCSVRLSILSITVPKPNCFDWRNVTDFPLESRISFGVDIDL